MLSLLFLLQAPEEEQDGSGEVDGGKIGPIFLSKSFPEAQS